MGPGEVNSMYECKPNCWLKMNGIHGSQVPEWLKTAGAEAGQLWTALEGLDPMLLRSFFKHRRLYVMVSDLERYYRGYRDNALIC